RMTVDTGSRSSITVHSPFAREHDLAARYHAAPERVTGWGVGGAALGRPVRLGSLRIGEVEIKDVAGELFTGDKGASASPDIGANLGGGVLSRFTVAFDYEAKRMYLSPAVGAGKVDAFDRSGLWLMRDGDAVKIAAVAPGSAGAAAGLAAEDRIL